MSSSKDLLRRAITHWPHDALRPTAQLGTVLAARLTSKPSQTQTNPSSKTQQPPPPSEQESNAILSLLANKFSTKYALPPLGESLSGGIMTPRSNPEYYTALLKDLREVPSRTWVQRLGIKLKGLVRFS